MATVIPFRRALTVTASATHTRIPKWIGPWFRRHLRSVLLVTGLLVAIGIVMGLNISGWPGRINEDEGTYVSEAWAIEYWKELAHYTYWYDHPPLRWILIAGYAVLTDGFERVHTALTVGREFMLITSLISAGLMYILARRVGLSRTFSSIAVVLFAVSPLSLHYHRMVFLDNLAIMFGLAAFAIAASPKKSIAAAAGAGFTFAMAMLCKETIAILFPALVWILIQHTVKGSRKWNGPILFGVSFLFGFQYILFATLKNELLQGPGHVSLQDALVWQLHGRPGTGSLLDPESGTFGLARSWVNEDPWLLLLGAALIPIAFAIKKLRPIAAAQLTLILMMCNTGYMPYPYVIALLPFAALLIAGTAGRLWDVRRPDGSRLFSFSAVRSYLARGSVLIVALIFAVFVSIGWGRTIYQADTTDLSGPSRQATQWIIDRTDKDDVIVVDDYVWPDLALHGYTKQIWFYKTDLDPEVKATLLPNGYSDIDYVVLGHLADNTIRDLPTVATAIKESTVLADFGNGEITVRKVVKPTGPN